MIKRIVLENFKCFDHLDANLSRITLLTGANSSGKSSFMQSILLFAQSDQFPLNLSLNGRYAQLGGFRELVFKHDVSKDIVLHVEYDASRSGAKKIPAKTETRWGVSRSGKTIKCKEFRIETPNCSMLVCLTEQSIKLEFIFPIEYLATLKEQAKTTPWEIVGDSKFIHYTDSESKVVINGITELAEIRHVLYLFSNRFPSNPHGQRVSNKSNPFLSIYDAWIYLQRFDSCFNYINSYEIPPARTYYQMSTTETKIKSTGEGFEQQLLNWSESAKNKMLTLNTILKKLKCATDVKLKHLSGGRFEILVKNHKGGTSSSLVDVGFGISQILPLLIADIQLSKKCILSMSQPERHLHPSLQANLTDCWVDSIVDSSYKQYMIETHSEYIINRLRLRIAEGKIKESDVACYYFENTKDGTNSNKITFKKDGTISGAPDSFFDTYMIDSVHIALAASERI